MEGAASMVEWLCIKVAYEVNFHLLKCFTSSPNFLFQPKTYLVKEK